jgi:ribonuclease D
MTITTVKKAIEAAQHPILLETPAQLAEAKNAWAARNTLGIDTEFVRERTYRADLGLVQISDGETAWLLDPIALPDLEALRWLLTQPNILKVLHSCSEDLEVLLNSVGALPQPLVDTQMACAMLGQPLQMGYHSACEWLFDVPIDKEQTRSNWCKRPLSERQLHYAAMDVVLLPEMLEQLRTRLENLGRWSWLEEDVTRMQRNAQLTVAPEEAYLRFNGGGRLDDPSLRVLRALACWREQTAMERNLARGFVIPDGALVQMAKAKPASIGDLRSIEGIHPRALKRYQQTLLRLISGASSDRSPLTRHEQLSDVQRRQINQMRKLVQAKAQELGVEPALLASRRELEKLIRANGNGEPMPERFTGWRKAVISDELLSVVQA